MCTMQRKLTSTGSSSACMGAELALACYYHYLGCRFDLDQPWSYDNYLEGHIVDSVNIVAWALDKVIKECLGDPLSPRVITQTLEKNVWNSTLKLSAALNSTALQVRFDDRAHRALPMALGNLVNGKWKVAGVYNAAAKQFIEETPVITWPRTGKLAPRQWIECAAGQKVTTAQGRLAVCEDCAAGTMSAGGRATSCSNCEPGANPTELDSRWLRLHLGRLGQVSFSPRRANSAASAATSSATSTKSFHPRRIARLVLRGRRDSWESLTVQTEARANARKVRLGHFLVPPRVDSVVPCRCRFLPSQRLGRGGTSNHISFRSSDNVLCMRIQFSGQVCEKCKPKFQSPPSLVAVEHSI
jgi:hypothetical protein